MKRATLVLASLALLLGVVREAKAASLPVHGQALALAYGPNGVVSVYKEGNGALDTGLASFQGWNIIENEPGFSPAGENIFTPPDRDDTVNSTYGTSSRASTSLSAQQLLSAYTSSFNSHEGVAAGWNDVAFANLSGHPNLRLNFSVQATLAGQGYSLLTLGTNNSASNPWSRLDIANTPPDFPSGLYAALNGGSFSAGNAWDSKSFAGGVFRGTFHIDSFYDSTYGGYGFGLSLGAWVVSAAGGGVQTVDALDPLSLQSVTLTDGTPVSGVTFDSGLTFGPASATPEPSSLALLGTAGVTALGFLGWRRRGTSAAKTERY
jgi:hypothetical protein